MAPSGGTVDVGSRHDVYFTLLQPSTLKLISLSESPRNSSVPETFFRASDLSLQSENKINLHKSTVGLRTLWGGIAVVTTPLSSRTQTSPRSFWHLLRLPTFSSTSVEPVDPQEKNIIVRSTKGWTYKAFASDDYRQASWPAPSTLNSQQVVIFLRWATDSIS